MFPEYLNEGLLTQFGDDMLLSLFCMGFLFPEVQTNLKFVLLGISSHNALQLCPTNCATWTWIVFYIQVNFLFSFH